MLAIINMIYLFNSAYRPNYSKNVVRTLFFPKNYSNEYRYRVDGQNPYVKPDQVSDILQAKNEDILVIFIDRFSEGGYFYHPLRKGKLIKCYKEGEKLFFKVSLHDFIYPINSTDFNSQILSLGDIPKLTNDDPQNTADGFYVIKGASIIDNKKSFHFGNEAWDKATEALKSTEAFQATDDKETIFARLDFYSNSWFWKNKSPKSKKHNYFFEIVKRKKYNLSLFYKYPNQVAQNSALLSIVEGDSLKIVSDHKIDINTYSNRQDIQLTSKRYIEDNDEFLLFEFESNVIAGKENLIAPNHKFHIRILNGSAFWIQALIAIFIFGISEIIFSTDLSSTPEVNLESLWNQITWAKLVAAILKGISLFWIFRLLGKKIM